MFSPYYAFARRSAPASPENHVAVNVALYGAAGKRWSMTERASSALERDSCNLRIGPSLLAWDGNALTLAIDEVTVPVPRRIKGTIRLLPSGLVAQPFSITRDGAHFWHPIAPLSRVEVCFDRPATRWTGRGYFDCNWGSEPLEKGFTRWDWSRSAAPDRTIIFYDTESSTGLDRPLSLAINPAGEVTHFDPPPIRKIPSTMWRIGRRTRADSAAHARVAHTLEDTPFYARSLIGTELHGEKSVLMHESLDLTRFANPVVQMMLPFRMPRRRR